MPDEVDSCVDQVMDDGKTEEEAWAICVDSVVNNMDDSDGDLEAALERAGASDMFGTFERLIDADVEKDLVKEVIDATLIGGSREMAFGKLAKSDKLEKVSFDAEVHSSTTIFKAGEDFIIWGPASVEVVDKEGDRIKAAALQDALPQLLKRARLSLEHSDQIVGRILENFKTEEPVTVEIGDGDATIERSDFPTDVLQLGDMEPALYVAGEVYNDTRQSREARKKIEDGTYDSYSISGEALVTRKKIEDGKAYNDIVDMDLSAVTLCEEGMNQKAKFGVVSDGDTDGEVEASADDASGGRVEPSAEAIAAVAKSATEQHMSDNTQGGDESGDGLSEEMLQEQFGKVLEQSLDERFPEGDLATKDDVLDKDEVEDIAEKVYERYEDGDIPDPSEGASEANTGEMKQQQGGNRAGQGSEDVAGEEGGADSSDEGQPNPDARTHADPGQSDTSGDQARSEGAPDSEGENVTQKQEDDAGDEDDVDSGTSDTSDDPTGRPGDEADVHGSDADGAPDSEGEDVKADMGSLEQKLDAILQALKEGEEEDEGPDIDDLEDPDGDGEEEMPVDPETDDEEMPPEEEDKGDRPPEMEDEEEPEMPPEDEEDEEQPDVMAQGYSAEELQQSLPEDVWEVARQYLPEEEQGAGAEMEMSDDEEDDEEYEDESKIERAVRKVLSGDQINKTEGASTPSGKAEKSWDDEEPSDEAHGDNPALANFY